MAGRVTPGGPLSGTQALPGIGNGVVGPQCLRSSVEPVHAPSVCVATVFHGQKIAVGRCRIDAGQYRCRTLEDLIMQADPNARQVLALVDRARLPRCRLEHVVNAADADGDAQQVTQELDDAAIGTAADQRQGDADLAQPGLAHRQLEQHRAVRRGGREGVIECCASLGRLLVDGKRCSEALL